MTWNFMVHTVISTKLYLKVMKIIIKMWCISFYEMFCLSDILTFCIQKARVTFFFRLQNDLPPVEASIAGETPRSHSINAGVVFLSVYKMATSLGTCHGLLARYIKLRVAHAPGMPGTFFPRHHWVAIPTCIMARAWRTCRDTHVPWCMPESLTGDFLWNR